MTRLLIRTATVALATATLAAPTALARPAEDPGVAQSATTGEFPTRPVLDRPSAPPQSQPVTTPAPPAAADHGSAWTTIGTGVAASLLAIVAIAGVAGRARRTGRRHITV